MIEFTLDLLPESKPTGNLGRSGNLYQATAVYQRYNREFVKQIALQKTLNKPLKKVAGLLLVFFIKTPRSRPKDTGQLAGAAYDALVKSEVISDDKCTNFDSALTYVFFDDLYQGIVIQIAENDSDWCSCLLPRWQAKQLVYKLK